ncbi:hypothetical protein [Azospirillum thiophilum]|nr:hypothetical protein [Azospirillum thiophilum]
MSMHVAVVDIGSPEKKNLGWAIEGPSLSDSGGDVDRFIERSGEVMRTGPLALGFEAPMYVPMRDLPEYLTRGRSGEANRPFSAGAGCGALVTGLVVVPYILAGLLKACPFATASLDWTTLPTRPGEVFLFEAFVSGVGRKGSVTTVDHVADARAALHRFQAKAAGPAPMTSDLGDSVCLNLLGAALLRTGWPVGVGVLSQPCLVVRAQPALSGAVSA